jgi:hypothetical protein
MDMSSAGLDFDPDVFGSSAGDDYSLSSVFPDVDSQDGNPPESITQTKEEEEDDDGEEEQDEDLEPQFVKK